jgi:hypothetical protein
MRYILGILLLLLLPSVASAQTKATTSAVEASHIFCTVPCQLYGGQINNTNAASRWILLFDGTVDPGDGAVTGCTTVSTARPCIMKWYQIAANSTIGLADFFMFQSASRLPFKSGLVAVCSSTGPFTKTETADCVFSFEVQ